MTGLGGGIFWGTDIVAFEELDGRERGLMGALERAPRHADIRRES